MLSCSHNQAYAVLGDPKRREKYDREGHPVTAGKADSAATGKRSSPGVAPTAPPAPTPPAAAPTYPPAPPSQQARGGWGVPGSEGVWQGMPVGGGYDQGVGGGYDQGVGGGYDQAWVRASLDVWVVMGLLLTTCFSSRLVPSSWLLHGWCLLRRDRPFQYLSDVQVAGQMKVWESRVPFSSVCVPTDSWLLRHFYTSVRLLIEGRVRLDATLCAG